MTSCGCHEFQVTGICSHTGKPVKPPYVPIQKRILAAIDKAVEKHRRSVTPIDVYESREDRKRRAQELREQADALERM